MGKRIDDTTCHCLKLRRSAENIVRFYDGILAPSGITARQYSILSRLAGHSGCSVRELADATQLERSTMTRNLRPLIGAGYIRDSRTAGARDSVLKLTEAGEQVRAQAGELWQSAQEQLEEKVGRDRLDTLEEILSLMQDL